MERRVSLDQLDNESYEAAHKAIRKQFADDDQDLQIPSRKGSMSADKPLEPIAPCDFAALAKAFYGQNHVVHASNPQLTKLPSDFLYHIGFSSNDPLDKLFGDVKVG
jgi:hypothetical protein